ncbi:protein JTB [Trichogramma pretiosum]|uniref:protein JTB n=1 Tax=Trichogramma pretiosum TaxID=7493 RepID=UPI0006C9C3E0|nr:protein JTB [Trichogramma pretiosum]XP_014221016.1 protein JTB [Trichogramma pretiosum]
MIESCSKKRMLLSMTLLGGLTVLVLIVESHWTESPGGKIYVDNIEDNTTCQAGEEFKIISECHPCSAFEIASQSIGVCTKARYKEIIECKSGEKITRSCDKVAWLEERTFWKFQSFTFVGAILSCITVFWRENILRQRVVRKIARQLRGSV